MEVIASGEACGAQVSGIDLSQTLSQSTVMELRRAWLEHHVLAFPDQTLGHADLERLTLTFGSFGEEPFFGPIPGSDHIVALTRKADEQAPVFAENWHTDWSFLPVPPIGTCLYSLVIPPTGGNTGFANQHKALAEMPGEMRGKLEGLRVKHSAVAAYAPDGMYGKADADKGRSMRIRFSEEARKVHQHPLILNHPESGRETLFGSLGYIIGVEGMDDDAALELLLELYAWQTQEQFQYTHTWEKNMFVMWDNRSVLHRAYGGYDGYDRELLRITIGEDRSKFLSPA